MASKRIASTSGKVTSKMKFAEGRWDEEMRSIHLSFRLSLVDNFREKHGTGEVNTLPANFLLRSKVAVSTIVSKVLQNEAGARG